MKPLKPDINLINCLYQLCKANRLVTEFICQIYTQCRHFVSKINTKLQYIIAMIIAHLFLILFLTYIINGKV